MIQKQTPLVPYTEPVICTTNPKEWYIYFTFFHAGEWHDIKKREGINREKDKKKKKVLAEGLAEARHDWLKWGWNPITDPKFTLRKVLTKEQEGQMTFNQALTLALSKRKGKIKPKSYSGYENQIEYIKKAAEETGHALLPVTQIHRGMCWDVLDKLREIRIKEEGKFSNHAYNKYGDTLRAMFTVLVDQRGILEVNPMWRKKNEDWTESNIYDSYTEEEKIAISNQLHKFHFGLYRVMNVVYHTGIRPLEVLALKIEDVNLTTSIITIAPDLELGNAKDNDVRKVPINPHLYEMLSMMDLHKFPANYYVFGSPFKPGQGNRGAGSQKHFEGIDRPGKEFGDRSYKTGKSGAMREDFLTPSYNQVKRDTVTRLWKKLIIDEPIIDPISGEIIGGGLGFKKHLYGAKSTGTDDKIDAGCTLGELQIMYGHSKEEMTARYHKRKRLLEAKKSILEKSPGFISPGNKLRKVG